MRAAPAVQLKVDRPKLLEVTGTTEDEMARVVGLMQDLCPYSFGSGPHHNKPRASSAPATPGQGSGRKRAREEAQENEDESGSGNGGKSGSAPTAPRERGNRGEGGEGEGGEKSGGSSFEEWKERMRAQEAEAKKAGNTAPGHGTYSSLTNCYLLYCESYMFHFHKCGPLVFHFITIYGNANPSIHFWVIPEYCKCAALVHVQRES